MFGEAGNDRLIWNPGDGTDLFEGGDGSDTAEVNGGNGAEVFTVTANGDARALRPPRPRAVQPRHRDDRKPRPEHERRRRHLQRHGQSGCPHQPDASTAAPATTPFSAATAPTFSSAATATISSTATRATTLACSVRVTTRSSGTRATAATPSRSSRLRPPGFTTPISPRSSISQPTADGYGSLATSATSPSTSTTSSRIDFHALGGADTIEVNDLTGTDLPAGGVKVDLEARSVGRRRRSLDSVTVNGRRRQRCDQLFSVQWRRPGQSAPPRPSAVHGDATDQLIVNSGAGDDTIDASTVVAGAIA